MRSRVIFSCCLLRFPLHGPAECAKRWNKCIYVKSKYILQGHLLPSLPYHFIIYTRFTKVFCPLLSCSAIYCHIGPMSVTKQDADVLFSMYVQCAIFTQTARHCLSKLSLYKVFKISKQKCERSEGRIPRAPLVVLTKVVSQCTTIT